MQKWIKGKRHFSFISIENSIEVLHSIGYGRDVNVAVASLPSCMMYDGMNE